MRAAGVLCAVVLLLMCSAGTAGAAWDGTVNDTWYQAESAAGHDGTSGNPFQIHDEESLAALAFETNINRTDGFHDKYIRLMNNLSLNGTSHVWTPIGNSSQKFQGTFQGDGHTITEMNVTSSPGSESYYGGGLFGSVNQSNITSVILTKMVVSVKADAGTPSLGGLAGLSQTSSIRNCSASGTVTMEGKSEFCYVGGLVGNAGSSSITNCYANGTITVTPQPEDGRTCNAQVGGLAGHTDGSITNCYATCPVTIDGSGSVPAGIGGLAGYTSSSITNCYAVGTVTLTFGTSNSAKVGGLAGDASGSITNSVALNEWVNESGIGTGTITIGRFAGNSNTNSNTYAWRQMGLNENDTITKPVSEDTRGKNATNASTVMIWNNTSFYTNLGWTFGSGGDWKMSDNPNYRLPILAWQNAAPAVDASYLNITHAVTLTFSGSGTVVANRTLPHVPEGATIVFTITGTPDSFTDNDVKKTISGNTYTLTDLTGEHAIVAAFPLMPVVDSADITAYNTTAANITFTLNSSFFNATDAWVNLTNQSSTTDIIAKKISGPIAKGSTKSVQLTGLTPGQSYQLNITPLNTTSVSGGTPIIYTHHPLYTAPFPGITFVNATTKTAVRDPLYLASGQSIVIRANITNASTELKNETISWGSVQGFGFSASGGETAYPYNITLRATAPNAAASITVTVGGVTKMLNLSSRDSPVPPVPSGSSDGNMNGAYRVLFDTVGGSSISPATGLSSGDRVAKPADPVRDGFTFGGWYTNEDGTGAWDFTGGIPGDMTLYAAWITDERTTPVTTAATRETTPHTTAPQQTDAAAVITTATTEFTVSPALTEAPAPLAGLLAGLLAAGILLRRRE